MSELSDTETAVLQTMCKHQRLADILDVIHDYCHERSLEDQLTREEKHLYRLMRAKLSRISNFALTNDL